jgi:hypothetical protein
MPVHVHDMCIHVHDHETCVCMHMSFAHKMRKKFDLVESGVNGGQWCCGTQYCSHQT